MAGHWHMYTCLQCNIDICLCCECQRHLQADWFGHQFPADYWQPVHAVVWSDQWPRHSPRTSLLPLLRTLIYSLMLQLQVVSLVCVISKWVCHLFFHTFALFLMLILHFNSRCSLTMSHLLCSLCFFYICAAGVFWDMLSTHCLACV